MLYVPKIWPHLIRLPSATETGANSGKKGFRGHSGAAEATIFVTMDEVSSAVMGVQSVEVSDEVEWIIDTGAERHLTYRIDLLRNVREKEITCVLPNNTTFKTAHVGDMHLETLVEGKKVDLIVKDVYYRERLGVNLLSHALIDENGCLIVKQDDQRFIQRTDTGITVLELVRKGGLYVGRASPKGTKPSTQLQAIHGPENSRHDCRDRTLHECINKCILEPRR
jgi:hypothetical protein